MTFITAGSRRILAAATALVLVSHVFLGGASTTLALGVPFPVVLCHSLGDGMYEAVTVPDEETLLIHASHEDDLFAEASEDGCPEEEESSDPQADLGITKVVDEPMPNIGGMVTYGLAVTNYGPNNATGVKVIDVLPSELIFWYADPGAAYDNATSTWTIGDLAVGATVTLDIYAKAKLQAGDTAPVNIATVSSDLADPKMSNNAASATIEIGIPIICVHNEAHVTKVYYVIRGTHKDGSDITDADRSDETKVIGAPDGLFYSLGKGGRMKLAFGGYVVNTSGNDFVVHEKDTGDDAAETALVEVSQDGDTWYPVGTAHGGDTAFDLSTVDLPWIEFIRVTDTTDYEDQGDMADGFDLDAIDVSYLLSCDTVGGGSGGNEEEGGANNPLGSITGVVFEDANGNAVKDEGEPELSGWVVYIDSNDNGTLDANEVSKTTASPYVFQNLADGTYIVRQVLKSSWQQTLPTESQNYKYIVVIANANSVNNIDFGNVRLGGGSFTSSVTSGGGGGSSSGGSGSSAGGSGSGGSAPTGQVLGDSTNVPSSSSVSAPVGQILDATTLPRTGLSLMFLLLSLSATLGAAFVFASYKQPIVVKKK